MSRTDLWQQRFEEASRHHGGKCVGLAIGIRALDVAERELGVSAGSPALKLRVGTKKCIGDAFKSLLHLDSEQLEYITPRDDIIIVKKGTDALELHLTTEKITDVARVFEESDEKLFPIIKSQKSTQ